MFYFFGDSINSCSEMQKKKLIQRKRKKHLNPKKETKEEKKEKLGNSYSDNSWIANNNSKEKRRRRRRRRKSLNKNKKKRRENMYRYNMSLPYRESTGRRSFVFICMYNSLLFNLLTKQAMMLVNNCRRLIHIVVLRNRTNEIY